MLVLLHIMTESKDCYDCSLISEPEQGQEFGYQKSTKNCFGCAGKNGGIQGAKYIYLHQLLSTQEEPSRK